MARSRQFGAQQREAWDQCRQVESNASTASLAAFSTRRDRSTCGAPFSFTLHDSRGVRLCVRFICIFYFLFLQMCNLFKHFFLFIFVFLFCSFVSFSNAGTEAGKCTAKLYSAAGYTWLPKGFTHINKFWKKIKFYNVSE